MFLIIIIIKERVHKEEWWIFLPRISLSEWKKMMEQRNSPIKCEIEKQSQQPRVNGTSPMSLI
jgi:hypothetical protein